MTSSGIPLVEKYRPKIIEDIVLDPLNKQILKNIIETSYFPNLLFYGPPGTGKTTTIINLINAYQEKIGIKKTRKTGRKIRKKLLWEWSQTTKGKGENHQVTAIHSKIYNNLRRKRAVHKKKVTGIFLVLHYTPVKKQELLDLLVQSAIWFKQAKQC